MSRRQNGLEYQFRDFRRVEYPETRGPARDDPDERKQRIQEMIRLVEQRRSPTTGEKIPEDVNVWA